MAFPTYFSDLPDIDYAYKINKSGKTRTIKIKDYFHLLTTRDDIFKKETLFYTYYVKDGQRPEQIAYEEYDDEQYYWVVLQVNEIEDYYNQWPLSQWELDHHLDKKYGTKLNDIHHYETLEVRDEDGDILLEAGLHVPESFVFEYQPDPTQFVYLTSRPQSVSNLDYEYQLNDSKGEIQLLRKELLYKYENEIQDSASGISPESLKSEIDIAEYYN